MESKLSGSKKPKAPTQKATVIKSAEVNPKKNTNSNNKINQGLLDKIQKCLNRARHPSANDTEAKAALFLAQRLMAQCNVTQADLIANDNTANKAQYAGRSVVSIHNVIDRTKRVRKETFVYKLGNAMCVLYDCRCYSVDKRTAFEWSFFGIAANTVTAARAFEIVHNKTLEWACAYKGGAPAFSYCVGLADGFVNMAFHAKKRELVEVRRKELDLISARDREDEKLKRQELGRIQRLAPLKVEDDDDSEDDDSGAVMANLADGMDLDDAGQASDEAGRADFNERDIELIDLTGDVDDNLERLIKREQPENSHVNNITGHPVKSEPSGAAVKYEDSSASPWGSEMQLVRFRAMSEQVAEDYLKERKLKLRRRKPRHVPTRDADAYCQGWKDSRKIDIPPPSTVT